LRLFLREREGEKRGGKRGRRGSRKEGKRQPISIRFTCPVPTEGGGKKKEEEKGKEPGKRVKKRKKKGIDVEFSPVGPKGKEGGGGELSEKKEREEGKKGPPISCTREARQHTGGGDRGEGGGKKKGKIGRRERKNPAKLYSLTPRREVSGRKKKKKGRKGGKSGGKKRKREGMHFLPDFLRFPWREKGEKKKNEASYFLFKKVRRRNRGREVILEIVPNIHRRGRKRSRRKAPSTYLRGGGGENSQKENRVKVSYF